MADDWSGYPERMAGKVRRWGKGALEPDAPMKTDAMCKMADVSAFLIAVTEGPGATLRAAAEALWEAGRRFGVNEADHAAGQHDGTERDCPWCTFTREQRS